MRKILRVGILMIMAIILTGSSLTASGSSKSDDTESVKAGFFYFPGYHMMDNNQNRSGYGYELLQKLSVYTSWNIEFVGYDNEWDDMLTMLDQEKIDMVSSARWTEERAKNYLFSELPVGTSCAILTTKAGNSSYISGKYETYDGMRVGVLKGNSRNDDLKSFAEENHFTYQEVEFATEKDLMQALQGGTLVDSILTSNLRRIENEWILDQFNPAPFYIITRKEDTQLMEDINKALGDLLFYEPNVYSTLQNKYYAPNQLHEIYYSQEEQEYIQSMQGREITALLTPDMAPLCSYDGNEYVGIIPDIMEIVEQRTGLNIVPLQAKTRTSYYDMLLNHQAMIRFDALYEFNLAEKYGYRLTLPYLKVPMSKIALKNNDIKTDKVAVVNNPYSEWYLESASSGSKEPVFFDNTDACIEAVLKREVDAAYLADYVAERYRYNDIKNSLQVIPLPTGEYEFCIGVMNDGDKRLASVLMKAIHSIGDEKIEEIILEHTNFDEGQFSIVGFFYKYPITVVIFSVVICGFVLIIILYVLKNKAIVKEKIHADDIANFLQNIYLTNDAVYEICLNEKVAYQYEVLPSKEVKKTEIPNFIEELRKRVLNIDLEEYDQIFSENYLSEMVVDKKEQYLELQLKTENGKYGCHSLKLHGMLQNKAHQKSVMLYLKNIEEAKRNEEEKKQILSMALESAKRANEGKSDFLSKMSHDIRTPMNAVVGMAAIAEMNIDDKDKVKDCLSKINLASDHLLSLLNDILDMTKIESGKLSLNESEFSLCDSISKTISIVQAKADSKKLRLESEMKQIEHDMVIGDQLRFEQVVLNVISNAVKYTPNAGQIKVQLEECNSQFSDRGCYIFRVKDTGIGMDEETLSNLFEPFERSKQDKITETEGTGLGMAIAKSIIDIMGGVIQVESELGKGTEITIYLYFSLGDSNMLDTNQENLYGEHVLVIKTEQKNEPDLDHTLIHFGMYPDIVKTTSEAIRKLNKVNEKNRYSLLIINGCEDIEHASTIIRGIRDRSESSIATIAIVKEKIKNQVYSENHEKNAPIFYASLPCKKNQLYQVLMEIYGKEKKRKGVTENHKGMRALIAEDLDMNLMFAKTLAQMKGFEVETAQNGQEAFEMIDKSTDGYYNVVLMDIQMPVMSGLEATKLIRASKRDYLKNIPIIAMTANAFSDDILLSREAGLNAHITKPIDMSKFNEVIDKLV